MGRGKEVAMAVLLLAMTAGIVVLILELLKTGTTTTAAAGYTINPNSSTDNKECTTNDECKGNTNGNVCNLETNKCVPLYPPSIWDGFTGSGGTRGSGESGGLGEWGIFGIIVGVFVVLVFMVFLFYVFKGYIQTYADAFAKTSNRDVEYGEGIMKGAVKKTRTAPFRWVKALKKKKTRKGKPSDSSTVNESADLSLV